MCPHLHEGQEGEPVLLGLPHGRRNLLHLEHKQVLGEITSAMPATVTVALLAVSSTIRWGGRFYRDFPPRKSMWKKRWQPLKVWSQDLRQQGGLSDLHSFKCERFLTVSVLGTWSQWNAPLQFVICPNALQLAVALSLVLVNCFHPCPFGDGVETTLHNCCLLWIKLTCP